MVDESKEAQLTTEALADKRPNNRPWYREWWVWFVIALPATAVVASMITLVLAIRSSDGMVAGDYYRRGLAINEQLERTQSATRLGLLADVRIDGDRAGDAVRVRLSAAAEVPAEAAITVRLVHPGRGGADRSAVLARVPSAFGVDGLEFAGAWGDSAPLAGRVAWRIVVEGRTWRLDGDADAAAWPHAMQVKGR